jgi:hypothetical protein
MDLGLLTTHSLVYFQLLSQVKSMLLKLLVNSSQIRDFLFKALFILSQLLEVSEHALVILPELSTLSFFKRELILQF